MFFYNTHNNNKNFFLHINIHICIKKYLFVMIKYVDKYIEISLNTSLCVCGVCVCVCVCVVVMFSFFSFVKSLLWAPINARNNELLWEKKHFLQV